MEKTALNVQKRANTASAKMEKRREEKAAISESSIYKLMSDKLHPKKEEL
jgi:predicted DNA-binding transcriptional regulator AlpA